MSRGDSFIDRWSRRKLEPAEQPVAEPEAALPDERTDAEIIEELDLPDPDTLGAGSDFSAFMKDAVPARLRNRALRQLWGTNPVLANLDELIDYGEDFTDAATVVENLQTAYQVGRGFVLPEDEAPATAEEGSEEAKEQAEEQAEEQDEEVADASPDADTAEPEAAIAPEDGGEPELDQADAALAPQIAQGDSHDAGIHAIRPRRMRFHVDGG